MNALTAYSFDGRDVRVLDREGEPWFVAADVCGVLGHTNTSVALKVLDDDERDTLSNAEGIARDGRAQSLAVVSESGLYTLILRSRKPQARPFRRWVTREVLPTIRRTGAYTVGVDLRRDAPPVLTVEQVRDVVRAELAAHAPGVPLSTHRVYLTDTLAQYLPTAGRETKSRYRQLVKLLADEHGRSIYRQDGTQDGRLYMLPEDAHILHRAWVWLAKGWGGGRRMLPGFGMEVEAAKHQKPTG